MFFCRRSSLRSFVIASLAVFLLASCSSSKKFARDPIYDAGKVKSEHNGGNRFKIDRNLDKSSRDLLEEAHRWLGTRYVYGGHSKSGTDCSGFVMEVYKSAAGIKMPRSTSEQRDFCKTIRKSDIDIGDLVFFSSRKGKGKVSHVGLYIGDGKMIHASSSKGVIISSLDERYYVTNYHSSGRVGRFRKEPAKPAQSHKKKTADSPAPSPVDRKKIKEIRLEELDSLLNNKIDSIYTDMLD